jgi:hypothetical protein
MAFFAFAALGRLFACGVWVWLGFLLPARRFFVWLPVALGFP